MTPKELVQEWIEAFNKADVDAIAELYADHAINHQVANDPIAGKEAIRQMFATEFFQDGDWVILEWKDPNGLRGCGFFQIQDNKIVFQRGYWDKLSFLRLHDLPIE
jgi:limonene-1,2-epoxide hydrolase